MAEKIGIIGLGSIGARHAKNLMELGCDVVAYDPKTAVLPGFDEVIKQSDAIIIASPTNLHVEHIMACQEKPTFVEKPIGNIFPALFLKHVHNVQMVGYMCRFHGCVKQVKKWLEEGKIGKPLWAHFTIAQRSTKYDQLILNWASHEIDLATCLLGPANTVAAAQNNNIADIVLLHKNGCQTTVHADYVSNREVRSFVIYGEGGAIQCDLKRRECWQSFEQIWRSEDTWDDNYKEEMQAFLDRLDGKETLGCTAQEAMHVLDLCMEAKHMAGVV